MARDEALLCIDGGRAAKALNFRYPTFSTEHAASGHASLGAPATTHSAAAALRGQLGPFVILDQALQVPRVGRSQEHGPSKPPPLLLAVARVAAVACVQHMLAMRPLGTDPMRHLTTAGCRGRERLRVRQVGSGPLRSGPRARRVAPKAL